MPQYLYRHFDEAGELLYVGVSLSAIQRLSQHKTVSPWFNKIAKMTVEQFPDRQSVLEAEKMAIINESPLYNKQVPKEVKKRDDKVEESKIEIVKRIVAYHPLYSIEEAAGVLKVSANEIKRMIEAGLLGVMKMGDRKTVHGLRPIWRISGWQLIDFIEYVQNQDTKVKGQGICAS